MVRLLWGGKGGLGRSTSEKGWEERGLVCFVVTVSWSHASECRRGIVVSSKCCETG